MEFEIYEPAEDTYLLLDNIKCGKKVLDMGTGSGIIAIECAKQGAKVVAVDIDEDAVKRLKKIAADKNLNIQAVQSNLFENVEGKYDTIIFNPPYLPGNAENIKDLQWAGGGEYGDEIILRFLDEAKNYLDENGEIYIVLSSFNRLDLVFSKPYRFRKIAERKLAFHTIYVYKLTPIQIDNPAENDK